MIKRSLNTLCLLLMIAVYAMPLHAQEDQKRDTAGLAAEMATMYKLYANRQYAFDIHYTFAASAKPEMVLDSLAGRLEVVDKNSRYQLGTTTSVANGMYNIILQSAMKKIHVSKPRAGEQPVKMIQAGFPPAAVQRWSVSQQKNQRIFHADFLPGFPFVTMDVKKDMATGYLTEVRYLIPASQLKRFGSDKEETKEEFGEYAVVVVTYTQDKKYTPDMTVFDEQSYFRKTETAWVPAPAFNGYQVFKASPDL